MKKKQFGDYLDPFIPISIQLIYAANILAILKLAGEIQKIDWGFIFIIAGVGVVVRIVKAVIKQALDEESPHAATQKKA